MEKKNSTGNIVSIILAILLLILGFFTYNNYKKYQINEQELLNEKLEIQADLDEKIQSLDRAIAENTGLKDRLSSFKDSLVLFKEEIRKLKKINYSTIKKYKNKLAQLEEANRQLLEEAELLRKENYALSMEIDSTKSVVQQQEQLIEQKQKEADSLIVTTREMSETITKASALKIRNIDVLPLRRKSNGKLKETSRGQKTDALRIKFTILENNIAKPGDREVFIIVKTASGEVIAPSGKFNDSNGNIHSYTDNTTVPYENSDKEVIVLTEIPEKALDKGRYYIDVYMEGHLQGTGKIELK